MRGGGLKRGTPIGTQSACRGWKGEGLYTLEETTYLETPSHPNQVPYGTTWTLFSLSSLPYSIFSTISAPLLFFVLPFVIVLRKLIELESFVSIVFLFR